MIPATEPVSHTTGAGRRQAVRERAEGAMELFAVLSMFLFAGNVIVAIPFIACAEHMMSIDARRHVSLVTKYLAERRAFPRRRHETDLSAYRTERQGGGEFGVST